MPESSRVLVDSTCYISWMRQGRSPVNLLAPWLLSRRLAVCGIIRIEVLRGVVRPAPREELMRLFDAAIDIPLSTDLMRNASELAWQLDRKGHVLPLSDLVIAACAKQIGAVVVSEDGHFRRIPGVKVRAALPSMDLL